MSQKTKFNYEDIYNFIAEYNCILLSKEYINAKQKLEIQCSCKEIYYTNFDSFKFKNKRRCSICSNSLISKSRKIDYTYVKNYIKTQGCVLLNENINNSTEKLKIQCSCGEVFLRSFNKFKSSNQIKCLKCQNITKWNYLNIKEFVLTESDCRLISSEFEYINGYENLKFKCLCGLEFSTCFRNFLYSNKRQCDKCRISMRAEKNKKGIEYLKQYINNNSKCVLIRIPFYDKNNIEEIVNNLICKYVNPVLSQK